MRNNLLSPMLAVTLAVLFITTATKPASATGQADGRTSIIFNMVRSAGAANCLSENARGRVTIANTNTGQSLHVEVFNMPPNTPFTLFVIQVPHAPFGLVWYQGDVDTDETGRGVGDFAGIFSIETFIMAPGVAPAPKVFPDNATSNPPTAPVELYHLGMWFADPKDAKKAGCADTVTAFDGDHEAGIQVLNTSNFRDDHGPLRNLK